MLQGEERFKIVSKILPNEKFGCIFRLVEPEDAAFIHSLRTNPILSRYVNPVEGGIVEQEKWIINYKKREALGAEFYIISIDPLTGSKQGVNRIYDLKDNSFELGSWLYLPDNDISKSIMGDIFSKELGFAIFGFDYCTFNVRKSNRSVVRYHKSFLPEDIGEDNLNLYFRLSSVSFNLQKNKFLNICGYGQSE